MRTVEIVTASTLMLLSAWFMVLALELPIGWEAGEGPGGGAFPFWLSLAIFLCAGAVLIREIRAPASLQRNARVFIHRAASGQLAAAAGGMLALVLATPVVGVYIAVPIFMVAYTMVIGKARWFVAVPLAVGTMLFMFFFFEVALKILLPKGFTEPLFFPLYAYFF